MLSSQSRKGRKLADRQNPVLNQDVVKLLKTQDAGYVTTILQKTKRARAKLEQGFVLCDDQSAEVLGALTSQERGSHTIFVDSREEQRQYNPDGKAASRPDPARRKPEISSTDEEKDDSDWKPLVTPQKAPESRRAVERQELALKQEKLLRKQHRKEQDARRSKLAALKARERDLVEAEKELDLQRAKMSNSVGGTTKVGVKWKVRERKK